MAPVKKSTTIAQRETRATRAATVAKKNATTAEKKEVSPLSKTRKPATKATKTTRRAKGPDGNTIDETNEEACDPQPIPDSKPTRTRTTKAAAAAKKAAISKTAATTIGATATRRRIRVTPLDGSQDDETKDESEVPQARSRKVAVTAKHTARARAADEVESDKEDQAGVVPKARSTRGTALSKEPGSRARTTAPVAKTRSKPRETEDEVAVEAAASEGAVAPVTRMTRARAGSNATQKSDDAQTIRQSRATKADSGVRKKVTFQDLPEDDKENQPLPQTKAKKTTTQKGVTKSTPKATGIRAKPVRSTAAANSVRARKSVQNSASGRLNVKETAKIMPTVLTPKKVSQVAKGKLLADQHDDLSDEEDELNGGKTPVRDLSMSPRRPPTSAMAKAMSPVKKLSFEQSLVSSQASTSNTGLGPSNLAQSTMLASPARRMPASPFKDAMQRSPKRGLGEGTRLLFTSPGETQQDSSASIAVNAANLNTANQNMPMLLQSPKRNGALDSDFFSQSAMKKSTSTSPFKKSLLASPAKRLFSLKKMSEKPEAKLSDLDIDIDENDADNVFAPSTHEVMATSHFRALDSPVRVHRMNLDASMLDFEESVLPIGSPLKIHKDAIQQPTALDESHDKITPSSEPLMDTILEQMKLAPPVVGAGEPGINLSELEKASGLDPGLSEDEIEEPSEEVNLSTVKKAQLQPHLAAEDIGKHQNESIDVNIEDNKQSQSVAASKLLRDNHILHEEEESSEDELAASETPIRSLPKNKRSVVCQNALPRQSLGVPSSAAGKGYGFTPLAAQINGWLASSPRKTPKPRGSRLGRVGSFEFSPVAAEHIDGEVVISRGSTPVQKMNKQDLFGDGLNTVARPSLSSRDALSQIHSAPDSSETLLEGASLTVNPQFEEMMAVQDTQDEIESVVEELANSETTDEHADFNQTMSLETTTDLNTEEACDDTILVHEDQPDDVATEEQSNEPAAVFMNFTQATDTAMIDFKKLAEEADGLAFATSETGSTKVLVDVEEASIIQDEEIDTDRIYGDENLEPEGDPNDLPALSTAPEAIIEQFPLPEKAPSPGLQPTNIDTASPSMLVIDDVISSPATVEHSSALPLELNVTPVGPINRVGKGRLVNTVVSKVPLKPEGLVSPIKMARKRARSFGNSDGLPAKRLSLGGLKEIQALSAEQSERSPNRRQRTSTAPSPGSTSTPASRYSRMSFGVQSAVTTPGQLSFAIDDFGDSTLDGIELPDDYTQMTMAQDADIATPAISEKTFGLSSMMATPAAVPQSSPATLKRSARRVTAPTATIDPPKTTKKTPQRSSSNTQTERTPLKAVRKGVLDGAIIFVDVHTSEGADASGIFVELLVQMGAKCVKEWRWNPRASFINVADAQGPDGSVGITHVVYKDGGKRTLEKVRDAKGEVCCVGVAWVLDCERESKWLDESTYMVDTNLMPRGGSRRRKSMEPRALLLNGNGSVSAGKPRRSVSAEMSEMMKRELVNAPARGKEVQQDTHEDQDSDEDTENVPAATPTGYVAYDPRTAMTPGTPYLADQHKILVQKSAPPKQTGKRLFEDDHDESEGDDDHSLGSGARGFDTGKSVSDAKKFKMRNLDLKSRRRTLGFKPIIGSPLSRTERH